MTLQYPERLDWICLQRLSILATWRGGANLERRLNIERLAIPRSLALPGKAGSNWKRWLYLERLVLPRNYLFLVRLHLQLKGCLYYSLP
jgi:hypothetical protein